MLAQRTEFAKAARAGRIFLICWLSGFAISYFWVYSRWRLPNGFLFRFFDNQLWFYPQQVLPHGLQAIDKSGVFHEIISTPLAMFFGVLFWVFVGFLFAWLTRPMRLYFTIPLAIISIFVALIGAQVFLYFFGIKISVDGP